MGPFPRCQEHRRLRSEKLPKLRRVARRSARQDRAALCESVAYSPVRVGGMARGSVSTTPCTPSAEVICGLKHRALSHSWIFPMHQDEQDGTVFFSSPSNCVEVNKKKRVGCGVSAFHGHGSAFTSIYPYQLGKKVSSYLPNYLCRCQDPAHLARIRSTC